MFYSAKMSVTIGSKTKDQLPEWVSLTPPISVHRRKGRGGKKVTFINICTQYFILKVVFIHENLTSDMQLMLDLDTINTSDYLYILAYYILFCSM
jgi:hypothetical protein